MGFHATISVLMIAKATNGGFVVQNTQIEQMAISKTFKLKILIKAIYIYI